MPEDYRTAAEFAQSWGLIYFVLIFLGALVYALAPSRKRTFDQAANMPLRED